MSVRYRPSLCEPPEIQRAAGALERHGIDHLSASSLNLWRASPGLWVARYLAGISEKSPAMWRGSAVEAGLAALWRGGSIDDARTAACNTFELNALGEASDEVEGERRLILPMLDRAAGWPCQGELAATQVRIEHWFEGIPVPIVGFVDFALMDDIDIDLKTTKACPSKPRGDHIRQISLYRAARMRRGGLLYVTDKRSAYFEAGDEDMEIALVDLRASALSLIRFLDRVWSAQDALSVLPIDWDDYRATPAARTAVESLLAA
jgi:hypothetical protein